MKPNQRRREELHGYLHRTAGLALVAALCTLAPAALHAQQVDLSGNWRAGATSFEVTIESWGSDCGPRPQSSHSSGGGLVTIEQKDQLLILHGRDQDIRTDACWSRNPAMKRTVASFSNGLWTMRCRTAENDPRAESGTYTLKQSNPNSLVYQDISRMDWSLNESKCVVTFNTLQTLTRAIGSKAPPPLQVAAQPPSSTPAKVEPTPPEPAPDAHDTRACTPGPAARLSVRPRKLEIEPGQRVCLRARVADSADCVLPNANVDWSLQHAKNLHASLNAGCFISTDMGGEDQGEFHITARSGNLSAEALVLVHKLDLSSLIAARMDPGLTGFDEEAQVEAVPKAVARIDTHTSPNEPTPSSPGKRFAMIGLGVFALALAVLGVVLSRRRAPAAVSGNHSSLPPEPSVLQAREAATSAHSSSPAKPASDAPNAPWICPSCRIGYPAELSTCPKDGTPLIPYAEYAQRGKRADQEHAKRCPTCGKTYPASASFCGNDGANLVSS